MTYQVMLTNGHFDWTWVIAVAGIMHLRAVRKDCQNIAFSTERNKTTGFQLFAGDSSTPAQMLS